MKTRNASPRIEKNKLAPLTVKAVETATKPGDIPTLKVDGDYPTLYNAAAAMFKKSEEFMKEVKPLLLPHFLSELFRHNGKTPWQPIKSVKLEDDNNEVIRISWIAKYSAVAADALEVLFKALRTIRGSVPNVNDYFTRTMVGSFNSSAFLGVDGRFSEKRYIAIVEAMEKVSQQLGIDNPLKTEEKVIPAADFDSRRWVDFDAETNRQISEIVPNQINFVPCPKTPEVAG